MAGVKPWLETWRADGRDVWRDKSPAYDPTDFIAGDNDERLFEGCPRNIPVDDARARLASAAPDMARALLELVAAWDAWEDNEIDGRLVGAEGTRIRDACDAADAALRKAGVRG